MVDDVGAERVHQAPRRQHACGSHEGAVLRRRRRGRAAGHELGADEIGTLMERRPQRPVHPAAELHPQHHRVPAPRAGAAAARPGRPADPAPPSRAGRSSWWSAATTTARTCAAAAASSASSEPVLIGVDAGADALLAAGHRPDIVVVGEDGLAQGSRTGDPAHRLRQGAARRPRGRRCTPTAPAARSAPTGSTGSASGTRRCRRPAPARTSRCCSPTSRGASLIVAVGTHATLDEFLDRQRAGLASTFLTRLRVGPKLVDAKGVPQLYAGRVRPWHLLLVLLAGLARARRRDRRRPRWAQDWWSSIGGALSDVLDLVQGLFS